MGGLDHRDWRPADWWTFVAMAEGSQDDRIELVTATSTRARQAWAAHHHVEEVVSWGGPAAALVIMALIDAAPRRDIFDSVDSDQLTDLILRQGDDLVADLESLLHRKFVKRGRAAP